MNRRFVNYEAAQQATQRAIENYNQYRPHRSCNYYTAPADRPQQAHQLQGELAKKWRVRKRAQPEKVQSRQTKVES